MTQKVKFDQRLKSDQKPKSGISGFFGFAIIAILAITMIVSQNSSANAEHARGIPDPSLASGVSESLR